MALDILARAAARTALDRTTPISRLSDLPARAVDKDVAILAATGQASDGSGRASYIADAAATAALATAHPRACRADATGRHFRLMPGADGAVPISALRLGTDGNDQAAIEAARGYAKAIGAGSFVRFDKAVTTIQTPNVTDAFTNWSGAGVTPQNVRPGVRIDARDTVIDAVTGAWGQKEGLAVKGNVLSRHQVTAAAAKGDFSVTVSDATGLAAGDWILLRLGYFTFDVYEPTCWHITRVTGVAGNVVTFKEPLPEDFTAADLADANNIYGRYLWKIEPITDEANSDFTFAPGVLSGLVIQNSVGVHVRSVSGQSPTGVLLSLQYSKGAVVDRVHGWDSAGSGLNAGMLIRTAETDVTFGSVICENMPSYALAAEAASNVRVNYLRDVNAVAANRQILGANGNSRLHIDTLELTGLGGSLVFNSTSLETNPITCNRLIVRTATMPTSCGLFGRNVQDEMTLKIGANPRETYRRREGRWIRRFIPLWNGAAASAIRHQLAPPNVLIGAVRITASAGATAGYDISINYSSFLGGTNFNGNVLAGKTVELGLGPVPGTTGLNGDRRRTESLSLGVSCDPIGVATAGRVGAPAAAPDLSQQYLIVELLVIPDRDAFVNGLTYSDAMALADLKPLKTLTYAANIGMNLGESSDFEVTLTGNAVFDNPLATYPGQRGTLRIRQDATGGRVATWGNNWRFPGGAASGGILSTAANATDMLTFWVSSDRKIHATLAKAMA